MAPSRKILLIALGACAGACARPGGPDKTTSEFGDAGVLVFTAGIKCARVRSSETLPARASVIAGTAAVTGDIYFTSALFDRFKSLCGACHVSGTQGNFAVVSSTFASLVTQMVIDQHIKTDDATAYMPPVGSPNAMPYSQRSPTDPVVQLVNLLELWIAQGSPAGSFSLNPSASDGGAPAADAPSAAADAPSSMTSTDDASASQSPASPAPDVTADAGTDADASEGGAPPLVAAPPDYSVTPEIGGALTNIGSCIPNRYIVGQYATSMDTLDKFFANATTLPDTIAETDLTTFDSEELARNGVISYYPAYPLWSDDAGKMRMVRVPQGQSIAFNKATQQFTIPPNTRFYKTFFKQVIDTAGNPTYKKIETRLIVARPDQDNADGTVTQTALFGTYVWDDAESMATLMKDPYIDGLPFADRLVSYVTDEPRADAVIATKPPNVEYVLEVENPGLVRHYALPGSDRCKQCHMGSPSASFVLGFTPLQVSPVPPGQSGVIEPATGDELTQLQRLIDFGVISGIMSPADVLPLEQTQLPRKPRNEYELKAQAYMVGNCAHCHNPRGFPSVKAPDLKNALNFLPGPKGGIFQFPLDRVSPVRRRGVQQDVPVPYITPSLRDYPEDVAEYPAYVAPKWVVCTDGENDGWCQTPKQSIDFIDAPWRSLVYRNVDTPFDYVDDYGIFPHMPVNTPGYDCRVPQIMGDWMVSIPATRVQPNLTENTIPGGAGMIDDTPQPYVEVLPSDPKYPDAQLAAYQRLAQYHAGHRYNFCPDTSDISDPAVLAGDQLVPQDVPIYNPNDPTKLIMPEEGVPNRANWVDTDSSDPPGDWYPRRSDWATALVQGKIVNSGLADPNDLAHLQKAIDALPGVSLTDDVRAALTKELPFGVWDQKPGCDLSAVPNASSFAGDDRPLWMNVLPPRDPNAPVYMQSPGAAVFTNICINCHGPQADAKGLLSDEISIMTGGSAQVANFRAGLFGPTKSPGMTPGMNLTRVFSPPAVMAGTGTPEDYGARYMAWMALGGTDISIPRSLLTIVATSPVLGARRTFVTAGTPNMLQLAVQLCTDILPADTNVEDPVLSDLIYRHGVLDLTEKTTDIIGTNGDAELWLNVCSLHNRPVVRVILPTVNSWKDVTDPSMLSVQRANSLYWGDAYPATAPVMDHRGHVVNGLSASNLFPMCVRKPTDATEAGYADAFMNSHPVGGQGGTIVPYCPQELFATALDPSTGHVGPKYRLVTTLTPSGIVFTDAVNWGIRGAINAGLAVFLYVEGISGISKDTIVPKPAYNQCELLSSTTK